MIEKFVIPGVKVQRALKRVRKQGKEYVYTQYFIYIPKAFEKYVTGSKWLVTVIIDSQEFPIGVRALSRHNKHYIIFLPNDLAYYWEKAVGKEVDVIFQRP